MQHFSMPSNPFNKLSRPLQEIGELNLKTLQKLSYINPQELIQVRDPKMLLEKNVQIFISNGRVSLDYVQQLFNIVEESMGNVSREVKAKAEDLMQESQAMSDAVKKAAVNTMQRTSPISRTRTAAKKTVLKTKSTTATKKTSPLKATAAKIKTSNKKITPQKADARMSSTSRNTLASSSLKNTKMAKPVAIKGKTKVTSLSGRKVAKKV